MQVGMALTPNSLARRKPGVQIPSPPPPRTRCSPALTGCTRQGHAVPQRLIGQQMGSNPKHMALVRREVEAAIPRLLASGS
jgi:hypothetical protein